MFGKTTKLNDSMADLVYTLKMIGPGNDNDVDDD